MAIYDLNKTYFLRNDIESILSEIKSLYSVSLNKQELVFIPQTLVENKYHWTSETCKETFNKLIPTFKSLHKDMYAALETIFKSRTGQLNVNELERKYPHFKEFRLLNNKFKHFQDKEAKISLTEIVYIEPQGNYIDVYINFEYRDHSEVLGFTELIDIFYQILEDEQIITIERK